MSLLSGGSNPLGMGLTPSIPGIPTRIKFDFFFDRANVQKALGKATYQGLLKVGFVVRDISHKSIKRVGAARPELKVMRANPDATLKQLLARSDISKRSKRQIQARLAEIVRKDASTPPEPPHTHTGMLRNSIVFAYDQSSESVVVGPFMAGAEYIAALHEHGGTQRMAAWAWIPKYPRMNKGILSWYRVGKGPRRTANWQLTSFRRTFNYPQRPFMVPAMNKAIASGKIASQFANRFRSG